MGEQLCENCMRPERDHHGEDKFCVIEWTPEQRNGAFRWKPMGKMSVDLELADTGKATVVIQISEKETWRLVFPNEESARAAVRQLYSIARENGAKRITQSPEGAEWMRGEKRVF